MQSSGRTCSCDRAALALILGFSLLTKLGLAFLVWLRNRAAIWHPDSASYHYLALNMFRHGLFRRSSGPPYIYEAFRTPGYPLLLAAVYRVFGDSALPVITMRDHKPLFQVHREIGPETERTDFTGWVAKRPEFVGRNHAVLGEQWSRDGMAIIARNPGWYVLMHLRSTAELLLDPGTFCRATLAGLETDQRGPELLTRLQTAPGAFMVEVWSSHRFLLFRLYGDWPFWLVSAPASSWGWCVRRGAAGCLASLSWLRCSRTLSSS
jgi:hypothetical protein